MKTKIILTIAATAGLSACAMQPNITTENPANVTFQFQSEDKSDVLTFWREMKADGTKGRRFSVGMNMASGLLNMDLEEYTPITKEMNPGTYFLDSYQASVSSKPGVKFCISEAGHYMMRNGWDDDNKKPIYMVFTVKEGQKLTLPEIKFDAECKPTITGNKTGIVFGKKFQ